MVVYIAAMVLEMLKDLSFALQHKWNSKNITYMYMYVIFLYMFLYGASFHKERERGIFIANSRFLMGVQHGSMFL